MPWPLLDGRILARRFFATRGNDELLGGRRAAVVGQAGVFLFDSRRDVLGVLADAVVGEQVELPLQQTSRRARASGRGCARRR